ncbi:FAD-dependent oxidoreductase [Rhodococcoides corynebacterioides]|uniref:FAD-dependent oxidoreductase n=1 Tax=Rhodococcoides corynebacterioides TaxID=53972 RepID=A0ABS7NYX6_9NOCA|nr:FAD-dependent oxidoreductase [Rhodococcus corynebacterioides]MBY6365342.1 FAD-dependent oxidoreductase [Rhodococcus corynebacterioides]MBY6408153.1 FAD-dependent oxidoreductase [Rhodococcus corynebacterioides]
MSDIDADVIVVGAGIAGLRCAAALHRRGLTARVLDADTAPGGRIRTDVVDGFRCDRGFQLLNPSYPAVRRHVDVDALDLRTAGRGVRVVDGSGRARTLADPTRHPGLLPATVRSAAGLGLLRPRTVVGAARWALPALGPVRRLESTPDAALADDWDRLGVRGPLRESILAPFLSGVLADGVGDTSDRYVRLVLRSFLLATPGVPDRGMQAFPEQLARVEGVDVTYSARVERIADGAVPEVRVADGTTLRARAVVVATDAVDAAALTSAETSPMRGLSTWWFEADGVKPDPFLRISGAGGVVVNTAQMSAVAPGYAPAGRTLVQATTLLGKDGPAAEADVRADVGRLWGASVASWRVIVRHDVSRALPVQAAGSSLRRPLRTGERLVTAGDHRDTPSIQGALVSGGRAAAAVARMLG